MSTGDPRPLDKNFSVPEWLDLIGLGQYAGVFSENEITPDLLISLTDSDLEKCGIVSFGHRKKILLAISELGQLQSGQEQPTPPASAIEGVPTQEPASSPGLEIPPATHAAGPVSPSSPLGPKAVESGDEVKPARPFFDRFGGRFLYISVLAHVVFGLIATWFVVQRIEAKRKLTFQAGNKASNQNTRALEHKVQMTKKKNTQSAPAPAKRITTTAVSARVAIPAMAMPMTSDVTPSRMAGTSTAGASMGTATMSGGPGGGGPGGGSMPFFGLPSSGVGLKGSFYDLKQSKGHRPTSVNNVETFVKELNQFVTTGWREAFFSKYFRAHKELFITQMFIPAIASVTAPTEFGVDKDVKPSFWMALYKGKVSPPESGTYYFVGGGDNILIVRLNGKTVLNRSWDYKEKYGMEKDWSPVANYDYGFANIPNGFAKGPPVELSSSQYYDMEILIGDDGGSANFSLLVEKKDTKYEKTQHGLPILPVFRLSANKESPGFHPPFQPNGPVWKSRANSTMESIFDH